MMSEPVIDEPVLRIERGRAEAEELAALTAAVVALRGAPDASDVAGPRPARGRRVPQRSGESRYRPPLSWTGGAGPDWAGSP